jgi:cytochrome P450
MEGGSGDRKEVEEDSSRRRKCLDFLDILLTAKDEHGEGLTSREVRDEVDTFLFEGQ